MRKLIFSIILFMAAFATAQAQDKIFTKEGKVSFYSDATLEDIEAHNNKATSVVNTQTGDMEFAVLIKAFQFEKALMQEHFNENYMESDQYPKATFKGKIADLSKVNFSKNGEYKTNVTGDLTIHGVTKQVTVPATFTVKDGKVNGQSTFMVALEDYKINIPSLVKDKIAKEVKVVADMNYQPLSK